MKRFVIALAAVTLSAPAFAQNGDTEYFSFGGDEYVAGQTATVASAPDNDAFAAGFDVKVAVPVAGDAHAAGFNVGIDAPVTGNVYAGGFGVTVSAPVGADITAAGNSVNVLSTATVGGNVRLAGQTVTLAAPVTGSAVLAGQTATLAGEVSGDVLFTGVTLSFTDAAKIGGTLTIRAPREIDVPASVVPASRVTFERLEYTEQVSGPAQVAIETVQQMSPWVIIVPILIWNAILIVVGLICFALFARRSEATYEHATIRPWYTLWVGFVAVAVSFGGFPALAMSLIGIPLIPIWLIIVFLAAVLAQVAGAYVLGGRILEAFNLSMMPIVEQLLGLVLGLIIIWVLSLIPFLGYLVWFAVCTLGLGGIVRAIIEGGDGEPEAGKKAAAAKA